MNIGDKYQKHGMIKRRSIFRLLLLVFHISNAKLSQSESVFSDLRQSVTPTDIFAALGPAKPPTPSRKSLRKGSLKPLTPVNKKPVFIAPKQKPSIQPQFEHLLPQFEQAQPPFEDCLDALKKLSSEQGMAQSQVQLFTVVMILKTDPKDYPGSNFDGDKNCYTSAALLSDYKLDIMRHIDEVASCKIDMEKGHGIIQSMLKRGFLKCLQTPFATDLLHAGKTDISLETDTEGNTLMHLAVQSGVNETPMILFNLEFAKSKTGSADQAAGIYWLLSALQQRNKDGKRPIGLISSTSVSRALKNHFRSFVNYLIFQGQLSGLPSIDEALPTSVLQSMAHD